MNLLPIFGQSSAASSIIPVDLSVLAQTGQAGDLALTAKLIKARKAFDTPAVNAPWADAASVPSISAQLTAARTASRFIDPKAPEVLAAGGDADLQITFTLYRALDRLRVLADYAADKKTPSSALADVNAQFRRGLAEVQAYVAQSTGEKTTFQFGDKVSKVKAPVVVPKAATTFTGTPVQKGERADALGGITGAERFSLTLSKLGSSDSFTVDLSTIAGPVTLDAVADAINDQISSAVLLDGNGQPILDGNGDPLTRYQTRAAVVRDAATGDWGLAINATLLEKASLAELDAAPAVYVASTRSNALKSTATVSELARFDVGGAPVLDFRREQAAIDPDATTLAARVHTANLPKKGDPLAFTPPAPGDIKATTETRGLAVDGEGNVWTVGTTSGDLDGQQGSGRADLFLTKSDSEGRVLFSRLIGAGGSAGGAAIAVDGGGNVFVAGHSEGKVAAGDAQSGQDSLLMKFDSQGRELFAVQLDSVAADSVQALAVDGAGDVFIAGRTAGTFRPGLTSAGGADATVAKLSGADGAVLSAAQFGSAGNDEATGLAVAADGSVVVASTEDGAAVVRRLDGTDVALTLEQQGLGHLGGGRLNAVAIDASTGAIAVAGSTRTALAAGSVTGAHSGETDGFVIGLGSGLSVDRLTYVGGAGADTLTALYAADGVIHAAGSTSADLAHARSGVTDTLLVRLDGASGAITGSEQIGTPGVRSAATAVAFAASGSGVLGALGLRSGVVNPDVPGDLVTQTSLREGDHFFVSVDGKPARKIAIAASDTYKSLAAKMKSAFFGAFDITVSTGAAGTSFEVKVKGSHTIDLRPGKDGQDALVKLGTGPARIVDTTRLFALDDEEEAVSKPGGFFALGLNADLALTDQRTAAYVKTIVSNAVATTQRAYRSLYFDPVKASLLAQKNYGPAPAYLTKQLAGYQDALARLQGTAV